MTTQHNIVKETNNKEKPNILGLGFLMTLRFKMQKKTFNLLCKKYKEKSNSKNKSKTLNLKPFLQKLKNKIKFKRRLKKKHYLVGRYKLHLFTFFFTTCKTK